MIQPAIAAALAGLTLAAAVQSMPVTTETTPVTAAAPTTTTTTVPDPSPTHPLTGVQITDPETYTPRPALIVKIDNAERARPQAGLNEADIVFEEIVEGGATRFAAVFNSASPELVGPIRSGRTQDVALFGGFNDPVFAFSGGNTLVVEALESTGWTLLDQFDVPMWRDDDRPQPHNLFASTTELFSLAGESGNAVPQFEYGAPSGTPVEMVEVALGRDLIEWSWDIELGLFLRSTNGEMHETTTGQFSMNNVVVLEVPYLPSPADAHSPEAQTVGTGPATVYAHGLRTEGTWTREDASQTFTLADDGGNPIVLTPGRTVIELADAGVAG